MHYVIEWWVICLIYALTGTLRIVACYVGIDQMRLFYINSLFFVEYIHFYQVFPI